METEPDNLVYRHNWAYLSLLLGDSDSADEARGPRSIVSPTPTGSLPPPVRPPSSLNSVATPTGHNP